ncbi:MAG: hypothetical protein HC903_32575 [Methylacidiphilales bacterium]|nr:hypothetical protein [Candidatus Methylacidiphilales bacterium]
MPLLGQYFFSIKILLHPKFQKQGLSLEFAADDRFYFMDESLRVQMFDRPHFGAAYGSNMFTPCKSFAERENLRVLVIDATTGEMVEFCH